MKYRDGDTSIRLHKNKRSTTTKIQVFQLLSDQGGTQTT